MIDTIPAEENQAMEEIRIKSFGQLHEAVMSYGRKITAYRGVKDSSYELVPKVGRLKFINKIALEKEEKIIITRFKRAFKILCQLT
jgi:hypothetical protein